MPAPTLIANLLPGITVTRGRRLNLLLRGAVTYAIQLGDDQIGVTPSAPTSIVLPSAQVSSLGDSYTVFDDGGTANVNNITVSVNGAATINGAATFVLSNSFQSAVFLFNGTNWRAVGSAGSGAAGVTLAGDVTGPSAANNVTALGTANATIPIATAALAFGAAPAGSGLIRMPNLGAIVFKKTTAGDVIGLQCDASNNVALGDTNCGYYANPGSFIAYVYGGGALRMQFDGTTAVNSMPNGNNLSVGVVNPAMNGASNSIYFANGSAPSANPSGGGYLQAVAGAERWRGSGGAITQPSPAGTGTQNTQLGLKDTALGFLRLTTISQVGTLVTYGLPTGVGATVKVTYIARAPSTAGIFTAGDVMGGSFEGVFVNIGGTVSQAGTTTVLSKQINAASGFSSGPANVAFAVSGGNILVQATNPTIVAGTADYECFVEILLN